jgi:hypothetical protein
MPGVRCIAFIVCAGLLAAQAGCTSPYQDKVIGTWETELTEFPFLSIAADGTGTVMRSSGERTSMTWRLNGSNLIFTIDGKEGGGLIKNMEADKFLLNDAAMKKDFTFKRKK